MSVQISCIESESVEFDTRVVGRDDKLTNPVEPLTKLDRQFRDGSVWSEGMERNEVGKMRLEWNDGVGIMNIVSVFGQL